MIHTANPWHVKKVHHMLHICCCITYYTMGLEKITLFRILIIYIYIPAGEYSSCQLHYQPSLQVSHLSVFPQMEYTQDTS